MYYSNKVVGKPHHSRAADINHPYISGNLTLPRLPSLVPNSSTSQPQASSNLHSAKKKNEEKDTTFGNGSNLEQAKVTQTIMLLSHI